MLRSTSEHEVANAIRKGDFNSIHDPEIQALVQWVNRATNHISTQPFSKEDAPEIVGTALTFQYINRMANVFLSGSLLPIPSVTKEPLYRLYAATEGNPTLTRTFVGTRAEGATLG